MCAYLYAMTNFVHFLCFVLYHLAKYDDFVVGL